MDTLLAVDTRPVTVCICVKIVLNVELVVETVPLDCPVEADTVAVPALLRRPVTRRIRVSTPHWWAQR